MCLRKKVCKVGKWKTRSGFRSSVVKHIEYGTAVSYIVANCQQLD